MLYIRFSVGVGVSDGPFSRLYHIFGKENRRPRTSLNISEHPRTSLNISGTSFNIIQHDGETFNISFLVAYIGGAGYNYPAGIDLGYNDLREKYMKKHSLLILSILLLLGFFLTLWYGDHLFNHLFILVLPLYVILFVAFITLLVISIRRIVKQKEYSCFIVIAVLALIFVLAAFFPFRNARVRYELNRFETDRLEIVEMIKHNQLQPKDEIGNVVLPAGYGRLSSDGEVFIYQNDENGQVIGFWVFRGMLSGSFQLIYSSGGEDLIWANESGHPITKIEKLKENWYYVETD